jgi:hypothetical protein
VDLARRYVKGQSFKNFTLANAGMQVADVEAHGNGVVGKGERMKDKGEKDES